MLFINKLTKGEVSRLSVARLVQDVKRMDHKAGSHLFSVPLKEPPRFVRGHGDELRSRSLICNL